MFKGYAEGYARGRADAKEDFERLLAILREELASNMDQLAEERARADRATDSLLGVLGSRAVSAAGISQYERQAESEANLARSVNHDPFAELPLGDPNGSFETLEQALIAPEE